MCICFANNPAEYWYWYLCDDVNIKPQDIFREPNSTKAQLLFTVKKTWEQAICIVQASSFRYKHAVYNKKGFRPLGLESFNMLSWWSVSGSNRWPPACKAGALPAELTPHVYWNSMVGLNGLEPTTSPLSGVRSNHLSYRPVSIECSYIIPLLFSCVNKVFIIFSQAEVKS